MKKATKQLPTRESATANSLARLHISRMVIDQMLSQRISHFELARRLKWTPTRVSDMLSGKTDLTLRDLADVCTVMGVELRAGFSPFEKKVSPAKMKAALEKIIQVLGPKGPPASCECEGCRTEMTIALKEAKEGLTPV